MLRLTGITNQIESPLLKKYVDAYYSGIEVCGLFGKLPVDGYLPIIFEHDDVVRLLQEATRRLEEKGTNQGELVFVYDLLPQPFSPKQYPAVHERMATSVKEAVDDARWYGITPNDGWTYRIERTLPKQQGENELVMIPTNNHSLEIDLYVENEKESFPVGGFQIKNFTVEGVIFFQEYPHFAEDDTFRPRTHPLPINYKDSLIPPTVQIRTGVLYNLISGYATDWLNRNAHGPLDPVVSDFGQARNALIRELVETPISQAERKELVEQFYTDPLQLLELTG